jgi:coenzyme PQQ precursor peptide PqqA
MMISLARRPALRSMAWTAYHQETAMKWETPSAIDFRFGMEITMYISNR